MKLWVDDLREPPSDTWTWAKTSTDAIDALIISCRPHECAPDGASCWNVITDMSLDHDLGGDDTTRPVVLWMCENNWWPDRVVVHSANPVGREWLEGMIARYQHNPT